LLDVCRMVFYVSLGAIENEERSFAALRMTAKTAFSGNEGN